MPQHNGADLLRLHRVAPQIAGQRLFLRGASLNSSHDGTSGSLASKHHQFSAFGDPRGYEADAGMPIRNVAAWSGHHSILFAAPKRTPQSFQFKRYAK